MATDDLFAQFVDPNLGYDFGATEKLNDGFVPTPTLTSDQADLVQYFTGLPPSPSDASLPPTPELVREPSPLAMAFNAPHYHSTFDYAAVSPLAIGTIPLTQIPTDLLASFAFLPPPAVTPPSFDVAPSVFDGTPTSVSEELAEADAVPPPKRAKRSKQSVADTINQVIAEDRPRRQPRKSAAPRKPNGCRNTSIPMRELDAPLAPRTYKLPSATSMKEVPKAMARLVKGKNPTDEEMSKVEAQRLKNTQAARVSRDRKREYIAKLEDDNERLQRDLDDALQRLAAAEAKLAGLGHSA